jgi:REP element-mobilizing transposase RayT
MVLLYSHAALFVAKGSRPFNDSVLADIPAFIRSVLTYKGVECVDVCVMPDHVHILMKMQHQTDLLHALQTLQYWLQDCVVRNSNQHAFEWDERVWVVSKSPSDIESVRKYFHKQAAYHEHTCINQEWYDMLDLEEIDD